MTVAISVNLKGPMFSKRITPLVEAIIYDNAIDTITKRMQRGGKGKGAKANTVSTSRNGLSADVASTIGNRASGHWPRTKGTAWTRKNMGIAKAMAPRVLRATAKRVVEELG